jgi:hypothetical protein
LLSPGIVEVIGVDQRLVLHKLSAFSTEWLSLPGGEIRKRGEAEGGTNYSTELNRPASSGGDLLRVMRLRSLTAAPPRTSDDSQDPKR